MYIYHCIPNSHGYPWMIITVPSWNCCYGDILIWLDKAMPGRPKIHNSQVKKLEILRQIRYVWATSNHGTFIILLHDAALFIDNKNTNVFLSNRDKILHVLYCINCGGSITIQPPKSDVETAKLRKYKDRRMGWLFWRALWEPLGETSWQLAIVLLGLADGHFNWEEVWKHSSQVPKREYSPEVFRFMPRKSYGRCFFLLPSSNIDPPR